MCLIFFCLSTDAAIDVTAADFWDRVLPEEKTPDRLLLRLHNRDALTSETQQVAFLEDIQVLVNETNAAWEVKRSHCFVTGLCVFVVLVGMCRLSVCLRDANEAWQDDAIVNVAPLATLLKECVSDDRFTEIQRSLLIMWLTVRHISFPFVVFLFSPFLHHVSHC